MKAMPAWFIGLVLLVAACTASPAPTVVPAVTPPPQPFQASSEPGKLTVPKPKDLAWEEIVQAAKNEGRLTLYTFSFTGELGLALTQSFKSRYGIKVDNITGRGAEFIERLKTEKRAGQIVADFTQGSPLHVKTMKKEGLTIGVAADLPVLKEPVPWLVKPETLDPTDRHVLLPYVNVYSPFVNTNLVKAGEEPKVWKDLLTPKWKGKMSMTDHRISGGAYLIFVPLLRAKVIDLEYVQAINTQDFRLVSSVFEEMQFLARGDRHLSIRGVDSIASRFVIEGAPIKAVELKDATVIDGGAIAVINGGPHPNAARLFTNWFLSAEGQAIHGKYRGSASLRKDVPDFRPDPVKFVPQTPIMVTDEDNEEATRLFREKWLEKLWGR